MSSTPTKSLSNFKESLNHFAFSPTAPLRRSARLLSTPSSSNTTVSQSVDDNSDSDFCVRTKSKRKILNRDGKDETPTKKVKKLKRGYATPEKYAHLAGLTDLLAANLDIIFCGINPGLMSATKGHHFANPTNHFWRALHLGGLTPRLLLPSEDTTLPQLYSLGLTDLVYRASAEQAELSKDEMKQSVPILISKVVQHKPRLVCFVGKGIWLIVESVLKQQLRQDVRQNSYPPSATASAAPPIKSEVKMEDDISNIDIDPSPPPINGKQNRIRSFDWGLQPYKFSFKKDSESFTKQETLIYVMPSTSARVVSHQLTDKVKLFVRLREIVEMIKEAKLDTSYMTIIPINDT